MSRLKIGGTSHDCRVREPVTTVGWGNQSRQQIGGNSHDCRVGRETVTTADWGK